MPASVAAPDTSGPSGPPRTPAPPPVPARVAARLLVLQMTLAMIVGVAFLTCYAGLQADPQPHRLPIAVVGEVPAQRVASALGARVEVSAIDTDAEARRAVLERADVAALSFTPPGEATLYVAGANGLAENAAAQQLSAALLRPAGGQLHTVDLVPTLSRDARALSSFYVALAAIVASFILAQAMFGLRTVTRVRAQIAALAVFAVAIGALVAALAGPVLHVVPAGFPALAPTLALLSVAVSFATRALTAWLGSVGIAIATLTMTAVGLSTSGGIIGRDLLPGPLGSIGAALPPGAGFRAVVSLGYFDGRASSGPILILALWALAGLGALVAQRAVRGRATA